MLKVDIAALPLVDGARVLKQTVGQSALAVVDVRYDAEIADDVHLQIFMVIIYGRKRRY